MPKILVGDQEIDLNVGPGGAEFKFGDTKVALDGDGQIVSTEAFGHKTQRVEGGMLVTRANGFQIIMKDNGGFQLVTPPSSVGIADLSTVTKYEVVSEGERTVHQVNFNDGGHANISFSANGEFAGLDGFKLGMHIDNDNRMLIGRDEKKAE